MIVAIMNGQLLVIQVIVKTSVAANSASIILRELGIGEKEGRLKFNPPTQPYAYSREYVFSPYLSLLFVLFLLLTYPHTENPRNFMR